MPSQQEIESQLGGKLTQIGGGMFSGPNGSRVKLDPTGYSVAGYVDYAKDPTGKTLYPTGGGTTSLPRVAPMSGGMGDITVPAVQSEEDIRASEMEKRKAELDAIEQVYTTKADEARAFGEKQQASQRGLNWLRGTVGSDIPDIRETAINKDTQKNLDTINAQKLLILQGVYDKIDSDVDEEVKAQQEKSDTKLKELADRAKTNWASIASISAQTGKGGFSDYVAADPQTYADIKRMTGYSDYELQNIWNQSIPENLRSVVQENVVIGENGNAFIQRASYNPITKKMESPSSYDTGVPYAQYKGANIQTGENGNKFMPNPADGGKTWIRITPGATEPIKLGQYETLVSPTGEKIAGGSGTGGYAVTFPSIGGAAAKNNNPLNIKVGTSTQAYIDNGQATIGSAATDGGNFLKFKDPMVGLQAGINLLFSSGVYSGMTLDEALKKWSNSGYGASIVPSINANKKISDLSSTEQDLLVKAMTKRESGATLGAATKQTVAQVTDETYDQAKQEAVSLFETNRQNNGDKKVSPDLYGEIRSRMPATKKDDFDKWASDAGYLSDETKRKFGIVIPEEKQETVPATVIGAVRALRDKNASLEDIKNYVEYSGYKMTNQAIQDELKDYSTKPASGFWNFDWIKPKSTSTTP